MKQRLSNVIAWLTFATAALYTLLYGFFILTDSISDMEGLIQFSILFYGGYIGVLILNYIMVGRFRILPWVSIN
jgi:hypothetical protein